MVARLPTNQLWRAEQNIRSRLPGAKLRTKKPSMQRKIRSGDLTKYEKRGQMHCLAPGSLKNRTPRLADCSQLQIA
jgi:hypothetical protein